MGTFQQCPADPHPSHPPFYKSAALQLSGEQCALSSVGLKVSFVPAHTNKLPFPPSCCQDLQERYKQVDEGSSLLPLPSPAVAEVALGGNVSPMTWGTHPERLSQPAQRAG